MKKKNIDMDEKFAIIAVLLVLFSAMIDPKITFFTAVVLIVIYLAYMIFRNGKRKNEG